MQKRVLAYIHEHDLIHPGDRVGVAVSAGADSVALLRVMLDLRGELGIVLAVVHFNHQIRGAEADADEAFVRGFARQHDLECHVGSGDAPAQARSTRESLETAARELRYEYFEELIHSKTIGKIATAHTMDDQAETVLLRLIRGAGTRGLAGIYPARIATAGGLVIRPFLGAHRHEVEAYLHEAGQSSREDSTNTDVRHARNRIRQELVPLLARDYNPNIVQTLARTAELARAEEEYWQTECARLLPLALLPGKPVRGGGRSNPGAEPKSCGLSVEALDRQPRAVRRRLARLAAESLGLVLDLEHVDEVLDLMGEPSGRCQLPGGWVATKSFRELRLEYAGTPKPVAQGSRGKLDVVGDVSAQNYEYRLPVPGEVTIPEINNVVRARLIPIASQSEEYNHSPLSRSASRKDSGQVVLQKGFGVLTVRNWRPGDKYMAAHSRSEKKVKELLQKLHIPLRERQTWPLVTAGDQIVFVQGVSAREILVERDHCWMHLQIEFEAVAPPGGSNLRSEVASGK